MKASHLRQVSRLGTGITPTSGIADIHPKLALEEAMLRYVDAIFRKFSDTGVPWCLLRNHDSIPSRLVDGSDIDIVVPDKLSTSDLIRFLADLCPVHIVPRRGVVSFYIPVEDRFLRLDYLRDQRWLGAPLVRNAEILASRRQLDGIPVASDLHQAFFAWFHSVLWGGFFKDRYAPLIYETYHKKPEEMRALLLRFFGHRIGSRLLNCVANHQLHDSVFLSGKARRILWLRSLVQNPISTLSGFVHHFWQELAMRHPAFSPGVMIAILGPDGAGKSAVCTALATAPKMSLPFTSVSFQHLYRNTLPPLKDLRRGRLQPRSTLMPISNPHSSTAHGTIISAIRMGYYLADQWLSELRWGRHQLAKNALRLHDRHAIDSLADPRRYRFGCPSWLVRLYARLSPRPDLVIVLDAPIEVLQARKQEVVPEESERQRAAYRTLVRQIPNGHIVDASRPLPEVVQEVREIIIQLVAQRTSRRFNLRSTL
mgnify:CR=1 FL=1